VFYLFILVLKANKGLNPDSIGNIKLKSGEGLTGLAFKEQRPICERCASQNINFRYFPGLGEEKFESFLAVPILRGATRIGVLVAQNSMKNYFVEEDIKILRAISTQLANTIEMTRVILSIEEKHQFGQETAAVKDLKFIKGKVGSAGLAFAEAVVLRHESGLQLYKQTMPSQGHTREDFHRAVQLTERQLEGFQRQIEEKLSDVASLIFTAQILMLKDKSFIDSMEILIQGGMSPSTAIIHVVEIYMKKFADIPDAYLREKSHDVQDIGIRLIENLFGDHQKTETCQEKIVIARELFPSEILKLSSQNVKGIILLSGGVSSHLSILAQSLQIPLMIISESQLLSLPRKTKILMDAEQGNVYVNPSQEIISRFEEKERARRIIKKQHRRVSQVTKTRDGTVIRLMANINLLGDLKNALASKAAGIGLYRTEFPFIVRSDFPSEEEQVVIYKKVVEAMPKAEITFRTLDIGGDKVLSYFPDHLKEENPFLGMRSIRFSLRHMDIFSQQIRAILRAGAGANIRIMFPMISSLDEYLKAREVVFSCVEALKKEKVCCHERPQIGVMLELPAVLEVIEDLAREADFFSVGTNDFVQYMLAVDRTNEKVADLYLPHHPSVLRALKKIIDAAGKFRKDVSICGDMVHEEKYLKCLLGMGLRTLSLNPTYILKIQAAIKKIDIPEAKKLTKNILTKSRLSEITLLIDGD